MRVELMSIGGYKFQIGRWKYKNEGVSFAKLKSTIMVVGQRESDAGDVDKEKGTQWLMKRELKKGKWGIRIAKIAQENRAGKQNLCNLNQS